MYEAGIIAPIRFSEWISNLVPTRNKTGEITFCVDLRNLKNVSLKDHYPLPKMDHILHRVVGASRISLLDGFSGFNQILVHPDDQDKTTFSTPWGTFKYVKVPFGLKNAGATFQRAMDIAFAKEIHDFLVIYLDDLTAFSKSDQEHSKHLRQVFLIIKKYGISLNPKKSLFGLEEGKLLGHIISKDGIRIDPDRIQAILQDDLGCEKPIAFFSRALRDAPLKYQIMEKQAYALVKAIKDFRVYILYSHIVEYVPNAVVKDILTQEGIEGKRGKWIANILEYDIEIKPKKLIEGQGLAKLMTETNFQALDINELDNEQEMAAPQINQAFLQPPWYDDICFVLLNLQAPLGLSITKKRFLKMKASKFCIIDNVSFWKNHEGVLLNCLTSDEADKVLREFHVGDCGGHLYWKSTADKILRAGFYWPSLFTDSKKFVMSCHKCQIFEEKKKLLPLLLRPISTEKPFQQWGLAFIGEIHPSSSGHHRCILIATDYFTKWIEAIPCRQANDSIIIQFLAAHRRS
eukprot:PITA_35841